VKSVASYYETRYGWRCTLKSSLGGLSLMTAQAETLHDVSVGQRGNLIAWLGLSCMAAALLSGVLKGLWELSRPILVDPQTLAFAPPAQRWGYSVLEVIKSAGFLAGLYGFYICATKRGTVMKVFMGLAVLGALFFAIVWMWIAVTTHFTLVYVLGGMWYQMIAPVALGVAALFARGVAWWAGAWAIVVGVLNSQIFTLLGSGKAMVVQGVIWFAFGWVVYSFRRRT
jgi:hypothetical protein